MNEIFQNLSKAQSVASGMFTGGYIDTCSSGITLNTANSIVSSFPDLSSFSDYLNKEDYKLFKRTIYLRLK